MRGLRALWPAAATLLVALSVQARDETARRFLTGSEAAARMTVPPGFRVKCFASEPEVINPLGIDFDHRGRVYVLECLSYPQKLPSGRGRDRIRIFEDTDGDGIADKVTTFAEGLNLATGIAVGFGGVFVGEAPELVFLQDTDGDDRADKRTVLLDGWGYHDTHETLNSFQWGPDGWLYGCHGVFTHSRVGPPGTPDHKRVAFSAALWRYHPLTRHFEVFAEGTSNPWGWDYDAYGSAFLTACVIPHLYHMIPGGLYVRQAGQNRNPYAYGEISWICDHVHYFGPTPHGGNKDPRSLDLGGGHAHAACLIYQGNAFPQKWHGRVFMSNIHGSRINTDILERRGSTFVGRHGEDFLVANDPNFRVIQLRTGPDGSVFMTDWYDPQICHNTDPTIWDRQHGRVYKVEYGQTPRVRVGDLSRIPSAQLVKLLEHDNAWWWRKALLILQERQDRSVAPELRRLLFDGADEKVALRALWALHNTGALDKPTWDKALDAPAPWVRAWAVRLLADRADPPPHTTVDRLVHLARSDRSADVRLQLACAAQKWRAYSFCLPLVETLATRQEDSEDPVIPLMIWLALEPHVVQKPQAVCTWLVSAAGHNALVRRHLVWRVARRLVESQDRALLSESVMLAGRLPDAHVRAQALEGMLQGLRGRRVDPPAQWAEARRVLASSTGPDRALAVRLGVHFGDAEAIETMLHLVADARTPLGARLEALDAIGLARPREGVDILRRLVLQPSTPLALKQRAVRTLGTYEEPGLFADILAQWSRLEPALRKDAIQVLTTRRAWSQELLEAVRSGSVDRTELTENDVRRILALRDDSLTRLATEVWGALREQTPQKVAEQLARLRQLLAELPGDRQAGRAVFEKHCAVCHKLFGNGHEVGPDLTGANRRDPEYLLTNILDPNRVVGRDYFTAVVVDKSGRVATGLVVEQNERRVVLKGENAHLTSISREEIEDMRIEQRSLMPEGLPQNMTEGQFRDLIAYLLEEPYLTRGLVAGPFKMALDSTAPVEQAADPLRVPGVVWKPFRLGVIGTVDMERLGVLAPPTDSTAYVYYEVDAPRALSTLLEVAADEDVKVWLNGQLVHRRPHAFEPARITVSLQAGTNRLLFKVHNIYGPSWLRARLGDPERNLTVRELVPPAPAAPGQR
ncbi:MAG: dehydrogenase [Gemmataceae bacterium]